MPIKQSAKKELRKAKKNRQRNLSRQAAIKDLRKKILKAISAKNTQALPDLMKQIQKAFDKAAKAGMIKKNTANRKKARLAAKVNQLLKVK